MASIVFSPSPGQSRLNVILPGLAEDAAFGGMTSALELARHLARHYDACRFVSLYDDAARFRRGSASPHRLTGAAERFFASSGEPLPCHSGDVFLVTYWAGFAFWEAAHNARLRHALPALPFYYFIQDYEPSFSPLGQKHALTLKSYARGELTHAVVNSGWLAEHLKKHGHAFAREYVLTPSLNRDIADWLKKTDFRLPPKDGAQTVILFYGRPGLARNCFELGVETLGRFFSGLPPSGRRRFLPLSVGLPHGDIALADGAVLKSLGRLPIHEYIALLVRSHVGLSLMISPHPSYPPLEMALFGMPTVTTDYGIKKMREAHPLLLSAAWPEAGELLPLLREGVVRAQKLKSAAQRAVMPTVFSRLDWAENFASLNIAPITP
ncbi:MAG: hypothetical protein LBB66_02580 [Desulfovibrio sp.]|jgi:hypothetical protein|nr:hypothetical protein [Desulfovibrio sp.]